jgi:tripartite ATP-independent transporter DctM subunit
MAKTLIILFFATLILGVPVAFTMGIAGIVAVLLDGSLNPLVATQRMFAGIDSFPLMAVPFFILASELMTACGLTRSLLGFANALVGHLRGGLGHVNILVSMLFAGISGSALADAAGPSAIVMRMMREAGYDKNYAGALSAATATIGPIIPPSILAVIFAISTNGVTVAGLFLAGIVPGVLLGLSLAVANHIISVKNGYRGRENRASIKELVSATLAALPAIIMPAIILGGILFGVFTPTEAGAVASAYALFLGLILRSFTFRGLYAAFVRAAVITSSVFLIVALASIFAWLLTYLQIPQELASAISNVTDSKLGILFILAGFALVCGFLHRHASSTDHSHTDPGSDRLFGRNRPVAVRNDAGSQPDHRHDHAAGWPCALCYIRRGPAAHRSSLQGCSATSAGRASRPVAGHHGARRQHIRPQSIWVCQLT